ncbi:MAG: TrmH family RNA methyltransferase [Marinilabiliales bacterium]|nr:TrmH family RNA methyltransferase [Marinilabiliales bacterium]
MCVLDNIRSQQNTGSVFRTADAFGLEAVWLCGITATPPHREIHRAALGATESVDWKYVRHHRRGDQGPEIRGLCGDRYRADRRKHFTAGIHPPGERKLALVFGNEVSGLDETVLPLLDGCIEILQFGTKHSFNVAVSAGIVIMGPNFQNKNRHRRNLTKKPSYNFML